MKSTCPGCGGLLSDETKQFCSRCENLALPGSKLTGEEMQQVSQIVLAKLRGDLKFKAQIIGAVLLVVVTVIGVIDVIVGFNLKESMTEHFQTQEMQAKQRIDQRLADLDDDVNKSLALIEVQMRSNITRNFEAPVIRTVIESVAKSEAKSILEGEVQPAVDGFREDAVFIRTVARAQAYDFKAYQRLLEMGTGNDANSKLANQVVLEIDRSLARDRSDLLGKRVFGYVAGTNIYQGPFTSDELANLFTRTEQDMTSLNREGFVNTVRELRQPLFLQRLIGFFTNETDLVVADRLAMAISDLTREDFQPRDFNRIQAWWGSRASEYTNWPFSAFQSGFDHINRAQYAESAISFQEVLKLDPAADMSRALAIASYLEIGETNRALELAKGFKDGLARWAQWTGAMTDLHTGSVSNATVRFADLTRMNPTMTVLPKEDIVFWRRIDWQLFHTRLSSEKPQPK